MIVCFTAFLQDTGVGFLLLEEAVIDCTGLAPLARLLSYMTGLSNMGLHQNVVMLYIYVVWGLSLAMISSLHNNFHLLETEEKSPEVGVCLPMWRGN